MACAGACLFMTSCGSSGRLGRHYDGPSYEEESVATTKADRKRSSETTAPRSKRSVAEELAQQSTATEESAAPEVPVVKLNKESFLQKVTDNAQHARFITSKVKLAIEVGNQQMTLTGNLRMKRDDVIRLQLMAFGFVEAGRLEFTKEYVLIMDRINKQYLKVPYGQLDFLRNSDIDFYVLQALFWNELFQPGKSRLADKNLKTFDAEMGTDDVVVSLESGRLSYRWLVDNVAAIVKMANIMFNDKYRGNYQLNWDYEDFKYNNHKPFPMSHNITFNTPNKEIKFNMTLNYMGSDEDWETRTEVSTKYRQVSVDDILRRFMSL